MTRRMIVAMAICLIAITPAVSASPIDVAVADIGEWFASVIEKAGELLGQQDDAEPPMSEGDDDGELGGSLEPWG